MVLTAKWGRGILRAMHEHQHFLHRGGAEVVGGQVCVSVLGERHGMSGACVRAPLAEAQRGEGEGAVGEWRVRVQVHGVEAMGVTCGCQSGQANPTQGGACACRVSHVMPMVLNSKC